MRLTKICMTIFAPDERLPSSATLLGMYFERLLPSLHCNRIHGEQPSRAAVFKNHNMNSVLFVASSVPQCDCSCAWKSVQDLWLGQTYISTTMYNKLYVNQLPCAADPSPDRELKEARPHLFDLNLLKPRCSLEMPVEVHLKTAHNQVKPFTE